MTVNSRSKGIRGELEASKLLKQFGFDARRGQQYAGGGDSPDVVHSIPGVHLEVKRVEALSLYPALQQAVDDAPEHHMPVVLHRRNGKPWVVIMQAGDFLRIMDTLEEDEDT